MSFSHTDLTLYLDRRAIVGRARQFILDAAKGLSRNVGTAPSVSVTAEMQSRKMGVTTHTESQTGELAYAIHLEFDDSVIAFYEQLPPIDCLRTDKHGKRVRRAYRGDFLILRDEGPIVVQIKHARGVEALLASRPDDWIEQDGRPVDVPAAAALRELGLPHIVVMNTDLPQIRVSNLRTLLHVEPSGIQLDTDLATRAESVLDGHAALSIAALAASLDLKDLTQILLMIRQKRIHALLDRQLLTQPESCLVTIHRSLLEAAVNSCNPDSTALQTSPVHTFDVPSKRECEVALTRLEIAHGDSRTRSARRWRKAIKDRQDLTPFQALLPRFTSRGNRLPKRPHHVLELAMQAADKHFGSAKRLTQENSYRLYVFDAHKSHPSEQPLSRTSFFHLIRRESQELATKRGGRRFGLAASAPSNVEDRAIPATRPFERASLDSCLCKVSCILYTAQGVVYVARPWLTVLIDNHSGQPLAWWVSFKRPNKRAIAMVLRDCVRRHGRLPESIICDWGTEHRSVHLSSVCAQFQVELAFRPKQHSRFGAQVERFFGMLKSHWLDLRPGNRTDVKNIRSVSSTHHPSKFAVIDLLTFMTELEDYVAWYCSDRFPVGTETCARLMAQGLERFPNTGRSVTYGPEFRVYTAVDEKALVVDPARGIKHGNQHFWHPQLKLCSISRKKVEVRLDPEDYTRIYARINKQWVTCRAGRSITLSARNHLGIRTESLLVMEGRELLAKAKLAADMALVNAIREADERMDSMPKSSDFLFGSVKGHPENDVANASQSDYWEEMNSKDVEDLDVLRTKR